MRPPLSMNLTHWRHGGASVLASRPVSTPSQSTHLVAARTAVGAEALAKAARREPRPTGLISSRAACASRSARLFLAVFCAFVSSDLRGQGFQAGSELWLPGDFDGDGNRDVAVVDRESGLIRLGRGQADGDLAWGEVFPSGLPAVTSVAVDRFDHPDRDSLVLVSPTANRVVRWAWSGVEPAVTDVMPVPMWGQGPTLVAGGASPTGGSDRPQLVVVSSLNDSPATDHLHLLRFQAASFQVQVEEPFGADVTFLGRANLGAVAGMRNFVLRAAPGGLRIEVHHFGGADRGVITSAGLAGMTAAARALAMQASAGVADLLVFEAGRLELTWLRLSGAGDGTTTMAAPVRLAVPVALEDVFSLEGGSSWRIAVREGGGHRLAVYRFNALAAGGPALELQSGIDTAAADLLMGVVAGVGGDLVVLAGDGRGGRLARSIRYAQDGAGFGERSRRSLPSITPWTLGANLLFLPGPPFLSEGMLPIARQRVGDWTKSLTLGPSPGSGSVVAERFGGATVGLATPAEVALSVPMGTVAGLVNQYRPNVSAFSWAPMNGDPQPGVALYPPAGTYSPGIVISANPSPASVAEPGRIWYRADKGEWRSSTGEIGPLSRTTTFEFCWRRERDGARGTIRQAVYSIRLTEPLADCDGDGVPDFVERSYGLDPCASHRDADNDGVSDLAELLNRTDPLDPASQPPDTATLRPAPEWAVQVLLAPHSHTGVAGVPPVFAPSLPKGPAGSAENHPTRIWLYDLYGRAPAGAFPGRVTPDERASSVTYAETHALLSPPGAFPAARFSAVDASFQPGLLLASTQDRFAIRLPDGTLGTNRGRELVSFVLPPSTPPDPFRFVRGTGSEAEETARWLAEAIAFYEIRPSATQTADLDGLSTMEVLLVEHAVAQFLFQRGSLHAPRLTLTPFRTLESLAAPDANPVPSGSYVPFPEELRQALESSSNPRFPAYALTEIRAFIHGVLHDAGDPAGQALRNLAFEFYRISALSPEPAASIPPSPIDAIRSFLSGGSLHQALVTSSRWELSIAQMEEARAAAAALPGRVPARLEREWTARLTADLAPGECIALAEQGSGQGLALVDARGAAPFLGLGYALPAGALLRIRGYAWTGGSAACAGLAIQPTHLDLLELPTPPVQDGNANGVADSLELYYLGMLIIDAAADADRDGVSDLEELRRGTDPRQGIPVQPFLAFGFPTTPLGHATLAFESTAQLAVRNLTASGEDGLRFEPGDVQGLRVDFDRIVDVRTMPDGAVFRATAAGVDGATLAGLRLVRDPFYATMFDALPDFAGVNSATYGLRLYEGAKLLHESSRRTAPPPGSWPFTSEVLPTFLPSSIRLSIRPDVGPVFECTFTSPQTITVVNDRTFSYFFADRIEFYPDGLGRIVPSSLSSLALQCSGLEERTIIGAASTQFGQEFRGAYGATLLSTAGELLIRRTWPSPPPLPSPLPPAVRATWALGNPLGLYGDWHLGNPGRFEAANLDDLVLGYLDLTDAPSSPLLSGRFRAGKSVARLAMTFPDLTDDAVVKVTAGGSLESGPGAATIPLATLSLTRRGSRMVLAAGPEPSSMRTQPGPDAHPRPEDYRLEVRLADGSVRSFIGLPEALPAGWESSAGVPASVLTAAVEPDGSLSLGLELADASSPLTVPLPGGETIAATAIAWNLKLARPLVPGSLRGLVFAGNQAAPLRLSGLSTSTANPSEATFVGGRLARPLGNARLRPDGFGSLVVNGLSASGQDGIAVNLPGGLPFDLELGRLGYSSGQGPASGATLDLRLLPTDGASVPETVLSGDAIPSTPYVRFGVRFPGLRATTFTLRWSLAGRELPAVAGLPVTAEGVAGPLIPYTLPDRVSARAVGGQLAWTLTWNRLTGAEMIGVGAQSVDRVDLISDNAERAPTANLLEFRASHFGSWTLPMFAGRSAPTAPEIRLNLDGGLLHLEWDEAPSTLARIRFANTILGPWQELGPGRPLPSGRRGIVLEPTGAQGYASVGAPNPAEGCLDVTTDAVGPRPNPWRNAGWTFTRASATGVPGPENLVQEFGGLSALSFGERMEVELPAPATAVQVTFRQFGGPVTFVAFDDAGEAGREVTSAEPTSDFSATVNLNARASRPLRRIQILGAGNTVHLRSLCLRPPAPASALDSRSCLPIQAAEVGSLPNPWVQGDLTLTARDSSGVVAPAAQISRYPDIPHTGYEVEYQAELLFAQPCPYVEIEYYSGSGLIEFQPYDDAGAALPLFRLNRATSFYGETVAFTGTPRPIARVVVTTPGGRTRLLKICGGPVPTLFRRNVAELALTPTRNPQPMTDTLWTFKDGTGALATSTMRPVAGETGLELTAETLIEFAADQRAVELRIAVAEGGATLSVEARAAGGGTFAILPATTYTPGVHLLVLDDVCRSGDCGYVVRNVLVKMSSGRAIVSRLGTPFLEE